MHPSVVHQLRVHPWKVHTVDKLCISEQSEKYPYNYTYSSFLDGTSMDRVFLAGISLDGSSTDGTLPDGTFLALRSWIVHLCTLHS
jgi:hypothetical protein